MAFAGFVAGVAWLGGWQRGEPAKSAAAPPVSLAKPLKEDQINVITLSPEAIQRLALRTSPVERKAMRWVRTYGGEIVVPAGQAIAVSASVGGLLEAAEGNAAQAGQSLRHGQAVFQLLPLLTPEGRANLSAAKVEVEGQVKAAESQHAAAQVALGRARRTSKRPVS
jgi:hypothetical protein